MCKAALRPTLPVAMTGQCSCIATHLQVVFTWSAITEAASCSEAAGSPGASVTPSVASVPDTNTCGQRFSSAAVKLDSIHVTEHPPWPPASARLSPGLCESAGRQQHKVNSCLEGVQLGREPCHVDVNAAAEGMHAVRRNLHIDAHLTQPGQAAEAASLRQMSQHALTGRSHKGK